MSMVLEAPFLWQHLGQQQLRLAAPNLLLLFFVVHVPCAPGPKKNRSQNGGNLSRTKTRNMLKGKFEEDEIHSQLRYPFTSQHF